jgi:hypothetical protein
MNDFDTETNVDNAMNEMIESRKEENYLDQERHNTLHDMLTLLRNLIELSAIDGKLPTQIEIGSNISVEELSSLWTPNEHHEFDFFGVESIYKKEANS